MEVRAVPLLFAEQGHHLLLPEEMNSLLSKFVRSLHLAGSPVTSYIIIAAARGIKVLLSYKSHGQFHSLGVMDM